MCNNSIQKILNIFVSKNGQESCQTTINMQPACNMQVYVTWLFSEYSVSIAVCKCFLILNRLLDIPHSVEHNEIEKIIVRY